jgi:CRISPR-associated protein (TIGR03984 family)
MTPPTGCSIRPLDPAECAQWLAAVAAAGPAAQGGDDLVWLLGHCDDGVLWGRREGARWRLSSGPFPEVSPVLGPRNVQQLRLFGPLREILLWKGDGLHGRELADAGTTAADDPLRPEDENYLLLGDRLQTPPRDGFALVADARGCRQAVPLVCQDTQFGDAQRRRWPLRLHVRHYFSADPQSGLVRVGASRLVHLFQTEPAP